jgi:quercetin dioxygenase-like cupin family protein
MENITKQKPATKDDQQLYINLLISNMDRIIAEYHECVKKRKSIPLYGFDGTGTPLPEWRAVTLWWDKEPWRIFQKYLPFTTEFVRHAPTHQGTGWLILEPHSRTPEHNHIAWGHKIIIHIPTEIPEGDTGFCVDGKVHHWKMGELFAFDANKNHYGYNNTSERRSIFVMEFDYDEWYDTLRPYMLLET